MRILVITRHLKSGGSQRAAKVRGFGFADRGHDVAFLAFQEGGEREDEIRQRGLELFVGSRVAAEREAAVRQAVSWNPDLIHVHRPGPSDPETAAVLRAIREAHPGLSVIECNHFGRVDYSPDRELIDLHMQLSEWCLWKFQQWSRGSRPKPVGVIAPHVIESQNFYPESSEVRQAFRSEHGIPQDAVVFGRFGSPIPGKWHPIIFEAFAKCAARRADAWLMVVGLPESLAGAMEMLPPDIRRRVVCPPFLYGDKELRRGYGAMDIFLHAALIGESFGQVFGESMLCEVPVITLQTPMKDNSQVEVVGHQQGGLVVHDARSMVRAMHELAEDSSLRARYGKTGSQSVKARFDTDVRITDLLKISDHVIAAKGDRELLRERLKQDPTLVSEVSWKRILELMHTGYGKPSLKDRLGIHPLHNPSIYRLYRKLRHRD